MKNIIPNKLKKGDRVAFFAPSGKLKDGQLDLMVKACSALGLDYYIHPQCYSGGSYLAVSDEDKVKALHEMFQDESISAIFCVRGGYGTMRYLDDIDYSIIKDNPKILIGMSDVTALQAAIYQKTGLVTYSGPMSMHFNNDFDFAVNQIKKVLMNGGDEILLNATDVLSEGVAEGKLIVGNLAMLSYLTGTEYDYDYTDSILMFEEVGEWKYSIDRFLQQLKMSGKLKKVNAIVVGENDYKENDIFDYTFNQMLENVTSGLNIPIAVGAKFGHLNKHLVLPVGQNVKLSLKKDKQSIILK